MPTPAIRTLVPFVACNSTDECAVVDESAACAERLCFCPSFEPLAKGTRCNTTRSVFPLALGNNCTAITDCSSTAACFEGQCRCPDGYQPSDEHNCSVIRQSDFAMTSWFAITILASSILLILMLVFYLCLVGYRSRLAERSFWRPVFGAPSSTTIVVSGQASFCCGDPTASTNMVPGMTGMTGETSGVALDSDPQTTGVAGTTMAGHHHEGHESSHASFLEMSTQGAAHSMTELRGIGGTPIESFVRPELSKERMYAKYPHLARMSVSASQRSVPASAQTRPTVSETASDEKSKKDENFPSSMAELSVKSLRRSSSRDSVKRTAASSKEGQSKGPQAACSAFCADGWPRSDSGVSRKQLSDVSVPWSSMGGSLEALLSVPIVARVRESSLSTREASQEAGNELHVPFDKLRD